MSLPDIFLLAGILLLLRLLPPRQLRHVLLTSISCVFLFVFQPVLPIRELDFNFPLWTILLVLLVYAAFASKESILTRQNLTDCAVIVLTVLLLTSTRLFSYDGVLTASRPPRFYKVLLPLLGTGLICFAVNRIPALKKHFSAICVGLILVILVILKSPALSLQLSRMLRGFAGQSPDNALSSDIRWFGFSYIAFRLLSILIDTQKGRKADISLGSFLIYVCFPPALSAGPIDRWDRFTKEYAAVPAKPLSEDLQSGLTLIAYGLFHKFILADALAKMALSAQNAGQFIHKGWAWAALFAYALQIFFDFSGYSEIALGLGTLMGMHLPKNFDHPYLKADLSKFWSAWHMTLTQWIRSYVFNPLTRSLRRRKPEVPQWLVAFITQMTTMLLIGLWHGITWNFIIWGLWHGLGLFIHQLYAQKTGAWLRERSGGFQKAYTLCSTGLTILFVCLGWVWFVVPDVSTALAFFGRLFG